MHIPEIKSISRRSRLHTEASKELKRSPSSFRVSLLAPALLSLIPSIFQRALRRHIQESKVLLAAPHVQHSLPSLLSAGGSLLKIQLLRCYHSHSKLWSSKLHISIKWNQFYCHTRKHSCSRAVCWPPGSSIGNQARSWGFGECCFRGQIDRTRTFSPRAEAFLIPALSLGRYRFGCVRFNEGWGVGYLSLVFLMSCLDCIKFLKPSMRSTSPEVIQHPSRLAFKTQQVLQGYIYRFAEQRGYLCQCLGSQASPLHVPQ